MAELLERCGERRLPEQRPARRRLAVDAGRCAAKPGTNFSSLATAVVRSARLRATANAIGGLLHGMAEQHIERQLAALRGCRFQRQQPAGDGARHGERRERAARRESPGTRDRARDARGSLPCRPPSARGRCLRVRGSARNRRHRCRSCADRRRQPRLPSRSSPRWHCRPRPARRGRLRRWQCAARRRRRGDVRQYGDPWCSRRVLPRASCSLLRPLRGQGGRYCALSREGRGHNNHCQSL